MTDADERPPAFRRVPLTDITVSEQFRKDMGDLDSLADSMAGLGLLQPVGLSPALDLKFGSRRLAAARKLGWESIPAIVYDSLADGLTGLKAQWAENQFRQSPAKSELVALAAEIEATEQKEAKRRQAASGATGGISIQEGKSTVAVQEPVP